ncbi:hypothetical protein KKG48_01345 [Patescibacteria group bacterium]|nr:hypothetical protein [Patescibacteria group bacterium]MCG2694507.1 hypothetical protein [Candidatus Parcubacteria bacterium]
MNQQIKNTQFSFDGKKLVVSEDLMPIFSFLMEIEKEINYFMKFNKKLEKIKSGYKEILNFAEFLSKKVVENKIDFEYNLPKNILGTIDEFAPYFPLRSQIIILFANIEVLLCLSIAYNNENSDKKFVINNAMNSAAVNNFLNDYFLTEKNLWYKENKKRASKIKSEDFRRLRNSLTHFFSLDKKITLTPDLLKYKSLEMEKIIEKSGKCPPVSLSPEDIFEMIRGASKIMMEEWNNDYVTNPVAFQNKINAVKSIIKKNGAMIIQNKDFKIK